MVNAGTSQTGLWVTALVIAHAVAGLFLARAYILCNPELHSRLSAWRATAWEAVRLVRQRSCAAPPLAGDGDHGSDCDADGAAVVIVKPLAACFKAPAGPVEALRPRAPPVRLEWRGLGVLVATPDGDKAVLEDVWGSAAPGELQAVLGPSGSGKSTLLDLLACRRVRSGRSSGTILVNSAPANAAYCRRTAYVPQEDSLLPVLTAHETLVLAAALKLPACSFGAAGHAARAAEALARVGLQAHGATLVGGSLPGGMRLRGLSGGERRRLSVAAALLAAPSVLLLDEPTSGLDSFAALSVMTHVQRAARAWDQVCVATIHQPRAALWSLFDQVTMLAHGRCLYTGPREGLVPWLAEGLGAAYVPEESGLPCDWALDVVATEFDQPEAGPGALLRSAEDVCVAAEHFKAHYTQQLTAARGAAAQPSLFADAAKRPVRLLHGAADACLGVQSADATPGDAPRRPPAAGAVGQAGAGAGQRDAGAHQLASIAEHAPHVEGAVPWQGSGQGSSQGSGRLASSAAHAPGRASPPLSCQTPCKQAPAASAPASTAATPPGAAAHFCARWRAACGGGGAAAAPAWWRQYAALVWREAAVVTRNPADVAGRLLTFTWVALLVGLLYYGLDPGASSIRPRLNLLFSTLCFYSLMPYICMSLYAADKAHFMADAAAQAYSPSAYYAAKVSATLPFSCLAAGVFSCCVYGMAGLRPGAVYVAQNCSLGVLMSLIASQVLHLSAAATPNQDTAFMASIAFTCTNLMFSSYFVALQDIPFAWLRALHYVSAMYYAFEGLSTTEFAGRTFACDPAGPAIADAQTLLRAALPAARLLPPGAVASVLAAQLGLPSRGPAAAASCEVDSAAVLKYFGFDLAFAQTLGVLLGYWLTLHAATLAALLLLARRQRRR